MREDTKTATKPRQPAWKKKLELGPGQTLRLVGSGNTGNLGQRDVDLYEVIDSAGLVVGSVEYSEVTSLKPPFLSIRLLVQKGKDAETIFETRW